MFPSAIMLCQWMTKMSSIFTKHVSVLEIGSGVGACGLMAAHIGCQRVVLSDFYIPLLQHLAVSACTARSVCPNFDIVVNFLDWNDDYCRWIDLLEPDKYQLKEQLVCKDEVMNSYERQHHDAGLLNKDLAMDLHPQLGSAESFDVIPSVPMSVCALGTLASAASSLTCLACPCACVRSAPLPLPHLPSRA